MPYFWRRKGSACGQAATGKRDQGGRQGAFHQSFRGADARVATPYGKDFQGLEPCPFTSALGELFGIEGIAVVADTLAEPISEREQGVLELIAKGLSNQEIADKLHISLHTVKTHARRINAKLEVKSRTQAIVRARELGLL